MLFFPSSLNIACNDPKLTCRAPLSVVPFPSEVRSEVAVHPKTFKCLRFLAHCFDLTCDCSRISPYRLLCGVIGARRGSWCRLSGELYFPPSRSPWVGGLCCSFGSLPRIMLGCEVQSVEHLWPTVWSSSCSVYCTHQRVLWLFSSVILPSYTQT